MFAYLLTPSARADIHLTPSGTKNIAQAVAEAQPNETIYLGNGTYTATKGNLNVSYKNKDLKIVAEPGAKPVWDLEQKGRALIFNQGGHTKNNLLQGITFQNGLSNVYPELGEYNPPNFETVGGGAILFVGDSSTIKDCTFDNNYAKWNLFGSWFADGGAIDIVYGSDVNILNSKFTNNKTTHIGGAVMVDFLYESKQKPSNALILNCQFDNNFSPACAGGGGIAFMGNSGGIVMNSLFKDNLVYYYNKGGFGGGIEIVNSNPLVANNTFYNNSTIREANKNGEGGGIRIRGQPYPVLINNLFKDNQSTSGLKSVDFQYKDKLTVKNSYLEEVPLYFSSFSNPETIQIGTDPGFVSADPKTTRDFSLKSTSPCIDAGADLTSYLSNYLTKAELADPNIIYCINHDLLGNPRVFSGKPDIGAVEYYRNAVPKNSWLGHE